MKKFTRASLKSIIRKHFDVLEIKVKSRFDGMTDMVEQQTNSWRKAEITELQINNTLGINGLWLVGGCGDLLTTTEHEGFFLVDVYNCCGSSLLRIPLKEVK